MRCQASALFLSPLCLLGSSAVIQPDEGKAIAAAIRVVDVGPPGELAEAIRSALAPGAFEIDLPELRGRIWLATSPEIGPGSATTPPPFPQTGRLHPGLAQGALVGALEVTGGVLDARGQTIENGAYTLRFAVQPWMKEHMGVSRFSDFLLVIPSALDDGSDETDWIDASRTATRTDHPAVISLNPVPATAALPTIVRSDRGGHLLCLRWGDLTLGLAPGPTRRP